jgi:hopanoid biosynthesis associated protein HpnK
VPIDGPANAAIGLIVTADDFGLSLAVNEAVEAAYRNGILRTASLMVGAPAAADAVARARRLPGLRVGLHLVLADGRPVLPPRQVAGLVDGRGRFPVDMLLPSVRLFFRPALRRQARAEIRAQFEAFRATGLPLDHVNAHKHLHLHPTVLGLMLEIGRDFGMRAVRLPNEPLPAFRVSSVSDWTQWLLWRLFIAPWMQLLRWRLHRAGVRTNDYVFGLSRTGAMTEATLLALLEGLPQGITEIYFHPCLDATGGPGSPDEVRALTSAKVRQALAQGDIVPIGFGDLDPQAMTTEPTEILD